ncbi:MAG: hypothetical protein U9O94_08790 [Nanoarchaeota archaeon]|nr:hypothetical protein [Nanoarchaeota archaeon]
MDVLEWLFAKKGKEVELVTIKKLKEELNLPIMAYNEFYGKLKEKKELLDIIQSEKDQTVDQRSGQIIHASCTHSALTIVGNAGHMLILERKRDSVFKLIETFIRGPKRWIERAPEYF